MIQHVFNLTEKESIALQTILYQVGHELFQSGLALEDNTIIDRGNWLLLMGDLVKGQRRSQQKFNLEEVKC